MTNVVGPMSTLPPAGRRTKSVDGQRVASALVDGAFFIVIGLLGWHGVLKEAAVLALLSVYATGRFGVAMNKQTANVASGGPTGPAGPMGPTGSSPPPGPTDNRPTTPDERPTRRTIVPPDLRRSIPDSPGWILARAAWRNPVLALVAILLFLALALPAVAPVRAVRRAFGFDGVAAAGEIRR